MDNESLRFFLSLSGGLHLLTLTVEVAGFFLCLSSRHLSRWTILVAAGFAGLFTAGVVGRLPALGWLFPSMAETLMGPILVVGGLISFLAWIAVVGGLWLTFVDFRRRLAMALEPKDGWR